EVALTDSGESKNKYAYWELKLKLYASDDVQAKLKEMKESEPGTEARNEAQNRLLRAMRKDLGFA
ncbi:hypothetical protein, partial [Alcanivorax borkumensis]|uniref:hypothetical protein n=1 Tax=Alcanivorax borkumensis TaxID=59754 RepID=UPI0035648ABC